MSRNEVEFHKICFYSPEQFMEMDYYRFSPVPSITTVIIGSNLGAY